MEIEARQIKEPTIFNSLLVCFFVAILLFVALLFRQKDLSLLAILILLVMSGSKIWSTLNFYRISCHCRADKKRVFPGETVSMVATLENHKFLPVWIRLCWPKHPAFEAADEGNPFSRYGAGLLWHQRMQVQQKFVALHRGVYHLGPPRLGSSDFFGFFQKEKVLENPMQMLVYPRLVPIRTMSLPKQDWFDTPGANSPIKDPVYILGTQDYQPSNPSRHIHWKASARRLRLQEKIFEPSEFGTILLAVDVGSFERNQGQEAFERTLEVVASLSIKLDGSGHSVGLISNGLLNGGGASTVAPVRNARQLPAILETLARLQMAQRITMAETIRTAPFKRPGISCALFSYRYGKDIAACGHILRQRRMPLSLFASHAPSPSDPVPCPIMEKLHLIDDIRAQEKHLP